jgi:hypothetical protein
MKRGEKMYEVIKKLALPLVVLGFYPIVKLLSEITVNLPRPGPDVDVTLKILEFLWAIALAVSMVIFYKEVKK